MNINKTDIRQTLAPWDDASAAPEFPNSGLRFQLGKFGISRTFGVVQSLKFFIAIVGMRWLGKFQRMTAPNGQTIEISASGYPDDEQLGLFEIFAWGDYKMPDELRSLPIRTVLDFGANVGMASLYFNMQYPNARILAYEALFHHFRRALANTKSLENVEVFCNAVCARSRILHFAAAGPGSTSVPEGDLVYGTAPVEGIDIFEDLESRKAEPPYLLKLDIEGGEYEIFDDPRILKLLDNTNVAFIELHRSSDSSGEKAAEIRALLESKFRVVEMTRCIPGWASVLLAYR